MSAAGIRLSKNCMNDLNSALITNRLRLKALLKELTTEEGLCQTALDGVRLARKDKAYPRIQVLYEPNIYIVASGKKIGFVEEHQFVYDEDNYLLLAVPLPFEMQTEVGQQEPMLGLSIRVDMLQVAEIANEMDLLPSKGQIDFVATVHPCALDVPISNAAIRLLEALQSPKDTRVLGPGIVREIIYHVLSGPRGAALVAMLDKGGSASKIQSALEWIHREYGEPLHIPKMAETLGMSVSSFHHTFKQITGSSPLQYIKAVRLHKARLHIKYDGLGASVTAAKVGYESPSQFSLDFKRFFGHPPTREAVRKKAMPGADGAEEAFTKRRILEEPSGGALAD